MKNWLLPSQLSDNFGVWPLKTLSVNLLSIFTSIFDFLQQLTNNIYIYIYILYNIFTLVMLVCL